MSLKRFDANFYYGEGELVESEDGDLVSFDEADAVIKRLQRELAEAKASIRELETWNDEWWTK